MLDTEPHSPLDGEGGGNVGVEITCISRPDLCWMRKAIARTHADLCNRRYLISDMRLIVDASIMKLVPETEGGSPEEGQASRPVSHQIAERGPCLQKLTFHIHVQR